LGDAGLKSFGRLGQKQQGLDLTGYRNGDPTRLVGIQCKCISRPKKLRRETVEEETRQAATYLPHLSEYFITTTADDDASLDTLCHQLTLEFSNAGRNLIVRVMGWQSLSSEIQKYPAAMQAFDPNYGPAIAEVRAFKVEILQQQQATFEKTEDSIFGVAKGQAEILGLLKTLKNNAVSIPADDSRDHDELDRYRALIIKGQISAARQLIKSKAESLAGTEGPSIHSRLKALEAHSFLYSGDDAEAARLFQEAFDFAPNERKGITAGVLSKIALGEFEAALSLATTAIKSDPENESVVSSLFMAAARVPEANDPFNLVAASIRETVGYCEGYLDFLRSRSSGAQWWSFAREKASIFHESFIIQVTAADSELDEFVQTTDYRFTGRVSDEWRGRLQRAVEVHRGRYDDIKNSENPKSIVLPGLACNFALLLSILECHEEAKVVLKHVIEVFPNDGEILQRAAMVCMEANDAELERLCLQKLKQEGNQLLLRVLILSRRGNWQELSSYEGSPNLTTLVGSDGKLARLLVKTASIRVMPKHYQRNAIRLLLTDSETPREHFVAISNVADALGFEDLSSQAYEIAKSSIDVGTHIASRLNFAMLAEDREDWRSVTKALDGHLDTANDTRELRMLARAFANAFPVTDRAIAFFERLPAAVSESRSYLSMHAFMLLKCGYHDKALDKIAAARILDSKSANLIVLHYQALMHIGEKQKIEKFIEAIHLDSVSGHATDQMRVAHVLARHGRRPEALIYAYNTTMLNRQIAEVELYYTALFLGWPENADGNPHQPLSVSEDCWVRTKDQAGQEDSFLIDASLPPSKDIVLPSSERAKLLQGLKVGESKSMGSPPLERTVTVVEIKHRFLHLLHDIMQYFNDRHPSHSGLQKITMEGDDIEPFLAVLRQRADDADRTAEAYQQYSLPITLMATLKGRSSLDLMEFLERKPFGIRTCFGSGDERKKAFENIQRARQNGAVLDLSALWTVIRLDAINVVKLVFPKLQIPDSVLNELLQLREDTAEKLNAKGGFTAYENGRYFLTEYTPGRIKGEVDALDSILVRVKANFDAVPAIAPDDIEGKLHELVADKRSGQFMDTAFVAAASGSVLVSEDAVIRRLSAEAKVSNTTWLQPVFAVALNEGKIDQKQYAELISGLARLRHGYVSVDVKSLVSLAASDYTRIEFLAEYIGSESADMLSHTDVIAEFAEKSVESENKQLKKALNMLLANLVRSVPEMLPICFAAIVIKSKKKSSTLRHLKKWCLNRGKAMKPILNELRKFERRQPSTS
jgi:tetratricopeptide (TPR) repeat protein/type IV secretory pathway TrbF-like protein